MPFFYGTNIPGVQFYSHFEKKSIELLSILDRVGFITKLGFEVVKCSFFIRRADPIRVVFVIKQPRVSLVRYTYRVSKTSLSNRGIYSGRFVAQAHFQTFKYNRLLLVPKLRAIGIFSGRRDFKMYRLVWGPGVISCIYKNEEKH